MVSTPYQPGTQQMSSSTFRTPLSRAHHTVRMRGGSGLRIVASLQAMTRTLASLIRRALSPEPLTIPRASTRTTDAALRAAQTPHTGLPGHSRTGKARVALFLRVRQPAARLAGEFEIRPYRSVLACALLALIFVCISGCATSVDAGTSAAPSALVVASCPELSPLADDTFGATTSKLVEVAGIYHECRAAALGKRSTGNSSTAGAKGAPQP